MNSSILALEFMPYNFGPRPFSDMRANITEFWTRKLLDVAMSPYILNNSFRGWLSGIDTSSDREQI